MRDFFNDYSKVETKEDKQINNSIYGMSVTKLIQDTKKDNEKDVEKLRKMVGIEVKKAFDTFVGEWEKTHEQPIDEPPKDEPPKTE